MTNEQERRLKRLKEEAEYAEMLAQAEYEVLLAVKKRWEDAQEFCHSTRKAYKEELQKYG